jgi:uncharacterized protein
MAVRLILAIKDDRKDQGTRMLFNIVFYTLGAVLIVGGLVGAILPSLPGIPMVFGGIWLVAAVDNYRHLGLWWLLLIGVLGALGVIVDFVAGTLGAKRVGASKRALWGASLGTLVGMFFGIPGILIGPFIGALLGELSSGTSVLRSAHVGIGTWIGLLLGALVKLVISLVMVGLFGFAMLIG